MERKDQTPNDKLLITLEKQLNIETKVKNGAENMIQSISGAHHGRDKKLLAEAQQMLADSKAKIEFLKLRILKVRRNGQSNKVSRVVLFTKLFLIVYSSFCYILCSRLRKMVMVAEN